VAITLDATVGGANANAYLDVAAAQVYFDSRLGASAWAALSAEDQKAALISATNRLDQEQFAGQVTDIVTPQRLKWPRMGAADPDGTPYDDDIIPRCIQDAVCEIALAISADATQLGGNALDQFSAVSVGPVSLTLRDGYYASNKLPAAAWRLIAHVLGAGSGQIRLVRG
jgi:hypothetical protein